MKICGEATPESFLHNIERYQVVQLNVSDRCNLFCNHCRPPGTADRGGEDMPPHLVDSVLTDLENSLPSERLMLCWIGEPLLNRRFMEILHSALQCRHGWHTLAINTNAVLLTPEISHKIVSEAAIGPRIARLVLSVDASSPEEFKHIKGIDHFDTVVSNVRQLLKIKSAQDEKRQVSVVIQCLITPDNAHNSERFASFWSEIVKSCGLKPEIAFEGIARTDCVIHFTKAFLPTIQPQVDILFEQVKRHLQNNGNPPDTDEATLYMEPDRPKHRLPCSGPWLTPVVAQDGRVTVCCRDQNLYLALGRIVAGTSACLPERKTSLSPSACLPERNASSPSACPPEHEISLSQIWLGSKAESLRAAHISGQLDHIPTCRDCGGLPPLDMELAKLEALRIGGQELLHRFMTQVP